MTDQYFKIGHLTEIYSFYSFPSQIKPVFKRGRKKKKKRPTLKEAYELGTTGSLRANSSEDQRCDMLVCRLHRPIPPPQSLTQKERPSYEPRRKQASGVHALFPAQTFLSEPHFFTQW